MRPQLSCEAGKDWTAPTNKHACSSDSRMDFMMFLNQVRPITLCGSDVTVHVMLAFGLFGKEGCFVLFFSVNVAHHPLQYVCPHYFLEVNEGLLFVK